MLILLESLVVRSFFLLHEQSVVTQASYPGPTWVRGYSDPSYSSKHSAYGSNPPLFEGSLLSTVMVSVTEVGAFL